MVVKRCSSTRAKQAVSGGMMKSLVLMWCAVVVFVAVAASARADIITYDSFDPSASVIQEVSIGFSDPGVPITDR